jgi:lysophospholipase L1-like esterase
MRKAAPKPASGTDFIVYGKYAGSPSGSIGIVQNYDAATTRNFGIFFGCTDASQTVTGGAISLLGTTNNGGTRNTALLASGVDYGNFFVEFALHWDSSYSTLTAYFKEADGRWAFKGRVSCEYVAEETLTVTVSPTTAASGSAAFDYLTVARPNLVAFGDSVAAGAPGFDPNPALALTNYNSTWMHWAKAYQSNRNNLIVNKGIGGQTSAQFLARIATIQNMLPKVVFLHTSTNDYNAGATQSARTATMQSIVNGLTGAGASVVLLNQMYGLAAFGLNLPSNGLRNYGLDSWYNYIPSLTGLSAKINIMYPTQDSDKFITAANSVAGDGHFSVTGYTLVGQYIAP